MSWLTSAFQAVLDKLGSFFQWFIDLFHAAFQALWFILQDAACWVYDSMLGVVVSALESLSLGTVNSWASYWSAIPADLLNVMGLIGLGECFAIISTAIVIRLLMQLIPFVRLGS